MKEQKERTKEMATVASGSNEIDIYNVSKLCARVDKERAEMIYLSKLSKYKLSTVSIYREN